MERLGPLLRISLGLALLTCSIVVLLDLFGLVPEPADAAFEARIQLCETLAAQAMPAAERGDFASIRSSLLMTVRRHQDVLSAGLRAKSGRLFVSAGDHRALWKPDSKDRSSTTHVRVPLFRSGKPWGELEVRFARLGPGGTLGALWERPLIRLLVLLGGLGFVAYGVYMRRVLRHLDPSAVIPTRVQAALDVMAEGVLLVDPDERIVLANAAFAKRVGRAPESLLGLRASSLDWKSAESHGLLPKFPWIEAIEDGRSALGTSLCLDTEEGERRFFLANGSPVLDGWGRPKGAIVTFDDVTELERKSAELEAALVELEKSRDEIRVQNEELQLLARRDPLTGVANRRTFLEWLEALFADAERTGRPLSCVMADVDHHARINYEHGHLAGDEVIRRVAELLSTELGSPESVCRYGGEKFCTILSGVSTEDAVRAADRLRKKLASPGFARVPITASFGVSSTELGAHTVPQLLDEADRALIASKQAGRDRVTLWREESRR